MRAIADKYEVEETMRDEVIKLADGLQTPLFATRDTLEEAYKYAFDIIETLDAKDKAGVITAMQVLVNTIAEEVKRKVEWR